MHARAIPTDVPHRQHQTSRSLRPSRNPTNQDHHPNGPERLPHTADKPSAVRRPNRLFSTRNRNHSDPETAPAIRCILYRIRSKTKRFPRLWFKSGSTQTMPNRFRFFSSFRTLLLLRFHTVEGCRVGRLEHPVGSRNPGDQIDGSPVRINQTRRAIQ